MKSYYTRAKQLAKEIKEMQEALKNAQKEQKHVAKVIAEYENLPASSGGNVKVRVTKTAKRFGEEAETETTIDFVNFEIYAMSREDGASKMHECLCHLLGLESASVTIELVQD